MLLKHISIKNMRSIKDAAVANCGKFNVFVGKNNVGKSNALIAIRSLFDVVRDGKILNLDSALTADTDFFSKKTSTPIEIRAIFELTGSECSLLIEDIRAELPQVTSVIDGLTSSRYVGITAKYFSDPTFSAITKIELSDNDQLTTAKVIFDVNASSILQLHAKFKSAAKHREELNQYYALIDNGALQNIKREGEGGRPARYLLERYVGGRVGDSVLSFIESTMSKSDTITELEQKVRTRIAFIEEEMRAAETSPLSSGISTIAGVQDSLPSYVLKFSQRLSNTKVVSLGERRQPIGPEDADRLLSLKVRRGGDKRFRSLQETVAALIGVDIDAFEAESGRSQRSRIGTGSARAELDVDNFLIQANGSGVKEALRLVLDLELDPPDIALIEEPEVHLHPALEMSVMRYLKKKSNECQVFITTHSANFLDSADYSSIFVVRKGEETIISRVDAEEAADVIPAELGIRLSSVFMFDRLIFVEGPSDEDVLREWAATLGYNLEQSGVGFVNIGGHRNITHYAAHRVTDFLSKRGVKFWFVIDRDEKSESEIVALKESIGDQAEFLVLPVREIENYLAVPDVLSRYIQARFEAENKKDAAPTSTEIAAKIASEVDRLKAYALAKHIIGPVSSVIDTRPKLTEAVSAEEIEGLIATRLSEAIAELEMRVKDVPSTIATGTESFQARWESEKNTITPGAEIIDNVLKGWGLRYKKKRDARQIARHMLGNEIPQDVREFLKDIADM